MNIKKVTRIILVLAVIALFATVACAQRPAQSPNTGGMTQGGSTVTIKGKIDYNKNLGGYFVMGENPAREYFIMNDNPKVLGGLHKSGKLITIEGRIVKGAEYLFIEKIDGKAYKGKQ
jgi:hypothetical protein